MTTVNDLLQIEQVEDFDLFLVFDPSEQARTVSSHNLKKYLLEKGFNPDAFVAGRIDQTAEILYMTNQTGEEIEIGPVISLLDKHSIQELGNVPPLEVGKLFQVNTTGDRVEFVSPFDLSTHRIAELVDVQAIQPLSFLRGTQDGSGTEWIAAASGNSIGIQQEGATLGEAHTINFNPLLTVTLSNEIATIDVDSQLEVFNDGVELGQTKALDFSDNLTATYDDATKTVTIKTPDIPAIEIDVEDTGIDKGSINTLNFDKNLSVDVTDKTATINVPDFPAIELLIKNDGTDLGQAKSLDFNTALTATLAGDAATIDFTAPDNLVTTDTEQTITARKTFSETSALDFSTATVIDKYVVETDGEAWTLKTKDIGDSIRVDENGNPSFYCDGNKVAGAVLGGIGFGNADGKLQGDVSGIWLGHGTQASLHAVKDGATELYHNGSLTVTTYSSGIRLPTPSGKNTYDIGWRDDNDFYIWDVANSNSVFRRYNTGVTRLYNGVDKPCLDTSGNTNIGGKLYGTWTGTVTPSDSTLKTNFRPINGLEKMLQFETGAWDWIDHEKYKDYPNEGFTAQSYQKVFPDQVEAFEFEIPDELKPETCKATKVPKSDSEVTLLGIKKDITGMTMDAYVADAFKTLNAMNKALEQRIIQLESQSTTPPDSRSGECTS